MPKLVEGKLPKYRHHKGSGQAVVTLSGRDIYLGAWNSKASRAEYNRLIGEWLAGAGTLPPRATDGQTIMELADAYWRFVQTYYVKHGRATGEQHCIKAALRELKRHYGRTAVADFGPLALKAIMLRMIGVVPKGGNGRKPYSRTYINGIGRRIKRCFRWAVSNELAPPSIYQALATVPGLAKGRTPAREPVRVQPVDDATVDATLPHLPPVVADMVRLQRLIGCRPGELVAMRPADIDSSGDVWCYMPAEHKTEHHDRQRQIFIGPRGQDVLRPYLLRHPKVPCFRSRLGNAYSSMTYHAAIHRACDLNGLPKWHPNQLRHSVATSIRRQFGLEATQVCLGHAQADVTQIYAETDRRLAADVMRRIG